MAEGGTLGNAEKAGMGTDVDTGVYAYLFKPRIVVNSLSLSSMV